MCERWKSSLLSHVELTTISFLCPKIELTTLGRGGSLGILGDDKLDRSTNHVVQFRTTASLFNHPFTNYSGHCLAHDPSAGYALVQALLAWMI